MSRVALFLAVCVCVGALGARALPAGMITYFEGSSCPAGWEAMPTASGRVIVSVTDAADAGVTTGKPLGDREDRVHTHTFATAAVLPEKQVAAIGCCNNQGAAHGSYNVAGTTHNSTTGYPFTQLTLCRHNASDPSPAPFGTVAFFDPDVSTCPAQWQPFDSSNGRVLVPSWDESGTYLSSDKPLSSGEARAHDHAFDASFSTDSVEYAGVAGCCNSGPSASGTVSVKGTSSEDNGGVPYVQLLTCVSEVQTFNSSGIPTAALVFNNLACPKGWTLAPGIQGRVLVGLPSGGLPGASFGGSALAPKAVSQPKHTHGFAGEIHPPSTGVGLASGCCAEGYAAAKPYSFSAVTDSTEPDALPYMMLPFCARTSVASEN